MSQTRKRKHASFEAFGAYNPFDSAAKKNDANPNTYFFETTEEKNVKKGTKARKCSHFDAAADSIVSISAMGHSSLYAKPTAPNLLQKIDAVEMSIAQIQIHLEHIIRSLKPIILATKNIALYQQWRELLDDKVQFKEPICRSM